MLSYIIVLNCVLSTLRSSINGWSFLSKPILAQYNTFNLISLHLLNVIVLYLLNKSLVLIVKLFLTDCTVTRKKNSYENNSNIGIIHV